MLWSLILIPLIAAAFVPLVPKRSVPWIALLGGGAAFVPLTLIFLQHPWFSGKSDPSGGFASTIEWMPDLGLRLMLDIDGVSLALVSLTVLLGPICVLASLTAITTRLRTYYGWLLILQAAMTGVFLARDAALFYIFFEFTLVPMFVLISLFGSSNRAFAAVKFFLYTFTGSVITLAGVVYLAWVHATMPGSTGWSFAFVDLKVAAAQLPLATQSWLFLALMCGFAIKVPLFPVHTWLPLAHTEAPTAGSVILAGVLLKLGTYGIYAIAIPLAPAAAVTYAPVVATLAVIGIIYGGLICWVQRDVKKLVAYSSVAHLGFCMMGMFALNEAGLQGSILYMINHGLSTGALFLLIGMMYERYHTRDMDEVGGLAARMPIWATFMVFFTMASVGLPGLNGFISEFLCVMGAFQASDQWGSMQTVGGQGAGLGVYFAFFAGIGMIIAAIYLLYMLGRVVFGPLREPAGHAAHTSHTGHGSHGSHGTHGAHATHATATAHHDEHHLPADLTGREIGILVPLAVLCVLLGVYPKPLMNMIEPSVQATTALAQTTRDRLKTASVAQPVYAPSPGAQTITPGSETSARMTPSEVRSTPDKAPATSGVAQEAKQ
jgi:NADH-quinone oxidoreductase subunit M